MFWHIRQNFIRKLKFYLSIMSMGAQMFCVVTFICQRIVWHWVHFAMLCMLVKYMKVSSLLQIKDSRLHFRYNLNSLRTEEKDIWLSAITVGDGQWHTAKVENFVSYMINGSCVEWDGKIDLEVCCYGQFESTLLVTVTKNRARIWTHWTNPAATLHCLNCELIQFLTCNLKHAR